MARKLVVVNDAVRLVELGNIFGPISTPTRIPLEMIRTMCVKNRDVWECDPNDPRNRDRRVKLTLSNYGETHFGVGEKKASENKPLGVAGMNMDSMDQFDPNPAHAETSKPKVPDEDPTPAPTEEKKGIKDYSYIMGSVNTDAADQFEPVTPVEEKTEEAETPASDPVNTASQEVKTAEAPAAAEEKNKTVPVQKETVPANNKNTQNHEDKKNKKGK